MKKLIDKTLECQKDFESFLGIKINLIIAKIFSVIYKINIFVQESL